MLIRGSRGPTSSAVPARDSRTLAVNNASYSAKMYRDLSGFLVFPLTSIAPRWYDRLKINAGPYCIRIIAHAPFHGNNGNSENSFSHPLPSFYNSLRILRVFIPCSRRNRNHRRDVGKKARRGSSFPRRGTSDRQKRNKERTKVVGETTTGRRDATRHVFPLLVARCAPRERVVVSRPGLLL